MKAKIDALRTLVELEGTRGLNRIIVSNADVACSQFLEATLKGELTSIAIAADRIAREKSLATLLQQRVAAKLRAEAEKQAEQHREALEAFREAALAAQAGARQDALNRRQEKEAKDALKKLRKVSEKAENNLEKRNEVIGDLATTNGN